MPSYSAPIVNLILKGGGQIPVASTPKFVVEKFKNSSSDEMLEFDGISQFQKHPTQTATLNTSKVFIQRSEIIGYVLTNKDDVIFDPEKALRAAQVAGGHPLGR